MWRYSPGVTRTKFYFTLCLSISDINKLSKVGSRIVDSTSRKLPCLSAIVFWDPEFHKYVTTQRCQQLLCFIALQIMSALSLRKMHPLLARHLQPGGKLGPFPVSLSGPFCGLWKKMNLSLTHWSVLFLFFRKYCQKIFLVKQ